MPLMSISPAPKWRYSMSSTDVLGYLVEVVSGQPFDEFLHRQDVRSAWAWTDTSFLRARREAGHRLATAYMPSSAGGGIAPIHEGNLVTTRHARDRIRDEVRWRQGWYRPRPDYLRFCRMLMNGGELDGERLLAPKTVQMMVLRITSRRTCARSQWGKATPLTRRAADSGWASVW